jgi:uncharacterized membrane protein YidH (DUF202 family)
MKCLTTASFDTCSLALDCIDLFLQQLSSMSTFDSPIESEAILSIVQHAAHIVNFIAINQYLFIEYAIDDYLFLDEHFHSIYSDVFVIVGQLQHRSSINTEIYHIEQQLLTYLPRTYSIVDGFSVSHRIASTLIEQSSRLLLSIEQSIVNHHDNDDINVESVVPSSLLFSSRLLPIDFNMN